MINKTDIEKIVKDIKYLNWKFKIGENNGYYYLQCIFDASDNYTGVIEEQRCRKWQLSVHMTKSEVVRTAHKAVLAAMEHEVDEHFKYKDKLIFCPHADVEALYEVAGRIDVRE